MSNEEPNVSRLSVQVETWASATTWLAEALLVEPSPSEALVSIGRAARTVTAAALAAIARPGPDGNLHLSALSGWYAGLIPPVLARDSLVSKAFTTSSNRISADPVTAGVFDRTSSRPCDLGSTAVVAVADDCVVSAVLVLIRHRGDPPFGDGDLALVGKLVDHGVALAAIRRQTDAAVARAVADDRERIAKGLRATVLPELVAVGLALQNTVSIVEHTFARRRMLQVVARIDGATSSLRDVVFALRGMST